MERPKLAPHRDAIRDLAGALGRSGSVNVKATTGEGMGFVGRGEGVAAWRWRLSDRPEERCGR